MMLFLFIFVLLVLFYWFFASPYSQTFGPFVWRGKTKAKVIALTFDDGPNEPYTSQIAEYLHSEGVSATFFLVGKNIDRFEHMPQKLLELEHVIGNHSYSHQFRKYLAQPDFSGEITGTQALIHEVAGKTPALFRPPWLFRNNLIFRSLSKHKLTAISGEFCHVFEIFQPKPARIAERSLAKLKPGAILIFHDGFNARTANRKNTVEAVKLLVPELKKRGYAIVSVDKLLKIDPYQS